MQYLHKHSLYITNPDISCDFYINKLGMKIINDFEKNGINYYHLSFNENNDSKEAILELIFDKSRNKELSTYNESSLNGYWKLAISIKDVDIARKKLISKGVEVNEAFQVPNVAYLCHFYDPDDYCIELIQHKFSHNHIREDENKNYILGNKPVFSLVTYKVKDINKSLDFYVNKLKLKLYSKMNMSQRGFNLYFLAPDIEKLPNEDDVESLDNIEWLWQREFTLIELQHIIDKENDLDFKYNVSEDTGFHSLCFKADKNYIIKDPDEYRINFQKY